MKVPMFEEIRLFYNKVRQEGMFLSDYLENKKYLRDKIDNIADEKLDISRVLYYNNKIDKSQYIILKNKIEDARANYKKLTNKSSITQ